MPDYKILIVDYDPRSTLQLRETLEGAGYAVEVAKDGVAGIEAFHRIRPAMAFIEAMIPKKHGFEVCQELKQSPEGKDTPIVIVTSVYKGRRYRTQAFHQHLCDEYLEKPINSEKLLEIVRHFLRPGGVVVAPAATQPAPPPAKAASRSGDAAEMEIMDRLDEILPDMTPGGEREAVVVSFDPARSRPRQPERPAAASTATLTSRGGASRAALDTATLPETVASAKQPAADPTHLPDSSPDRRARPARKGTGWIWIALGAALIAGIALIVLFFPR